MAFLSLDGIVIQVPPGSAVRRAAHLGQYARSYNGTPYSTVRTTKVDMGCTTTPMSEAEARALEYLLEGRGHVWSFDATVANGGLTSQRGLAVSSTSGTFATGLTDGKYGKCLETSTATTLTWTLESAFIEAWTVSYWLFSGGVWTHIFVRGTDTAGAIDAYVDGEAGADPALVGIDSSGVLTYSDGGNETVDDLVALPYHAPTAWAAHLFGAGYAFGPLPLHSVGGDWLAGRCTQGLTRWESTEPVNGWGGGVGAVVNFELIGG